MRSKKRRFRATRARFFILAAGVLALSAAGAWLVYAYRIDSRRGLPYYAHFDRGATDHWKSCGGTWDIVNGSMRNDSDERGAKLVTGSRYWRDYSVEADVQPLGLGDAGLLTRVNDAETGVDSYSGYYAGIRTMDNSLVLGRGEHGWQEYPLRRMPEPVEPFRWYHLVIAVDGCHITASVSAAGSLRQTMRSAEAPNCTPAGRVGLRSYSSGGVWRNVIVRPLVGGGRLVLAEKGTSEKLPAPDGPWTQRSILASYVSNTASADENVFVAAKKVQAVSSLRLVSSLHPPETAVRGVVVLKSPRLYVEDATGGVAVEPVSSPALKIGDEIEVTGRAEPRNFSALLKDAHVRRLWESSPGPPLSVTAN